MVEGRTTVIAVVVGRLASAVQYATTYVVLKLTCTTPAGKAGPPAGPRH